MALDVNGISNLNAGNVDLNGIGHSIPATSTLGFCYGTVAGGPYTLCTPHTVVGDGTLNQIFNYNVGFLQPSTQYYFVVNEYDATNTIIDTSTEDTFTTLAFTLPSVAVYRKDLQSNNEAISSKTGGQVTWRVRITITGNGAGLPTMQFLDPIPTSIAGVTRTWEVIQNDFNPLGTWGAAFDTGTGDINFQGAGTNAGGGSFMIDITDTIPAGAPIGEYENVSTLIAPDIASYTQRDESWSIRIIDLNCGAASNITDSSATIITTGSVPVVDYVVKWGTTAGGPYPNVLPAAGNGQTITGLPANTQIYYTVDAVDSDDDSDVIDTSGECTFTTLAVTNTNPNNAACQTANPSFVHATQFTISGTADNVPATSKIHMAWSTTPTGPWNYSSGVDGDNTVGQVHTNTWGRYQPGPPVDPQPNTLYYYKTVVSSDGLATIDSEGPNCQLTTRAAGDENYLACGTPSFQRFGLSSRKEAEIKIEADDLPVMFSNNRILTEIATSPTGPWVTANIINAFNGISVVNPRQYTANSTGSGGAGTASLEGIRLPDVNTEYWIRHTLTDQNNVVEQIIECGSWRTADHYNMICGGTDNITETSASVSANVHTDYTDPNQYNSESDWTPDEFTVRYGTTPGGPYPNVLGPQTDGDGPIMFTGLTPSTDYYYTIEYVDKEPGTTQDQVISVSPECTFRTLTPPLPIVTTTKVTDPGPYTVGVPIHSVVTVTNTGNTAAVGVTVVDPIPATPAGTTRAFTATETGGVTGFTAAGTTGINDTVDIPAGGVLTYDINDTTTQAGTYQNIVTTTCPTCVDTTPKDIPGGDPTPVDPPVEPPVSASLCRTDVVKLCTIGHPVKMCSNGTPVLFFAVAGSDGDLIPTTSTEFTAPAGMGAFSTIGFVRSYYTDLRGNVLAPQPTVVTAECTTVKIDPEIVCLVPNGSPAGTQPLSGVVVYDISVNPPTAAYYIGNTDVTATHTQTNCANNQDYEVIETCQQATANPAQKYTRVDWFEKSNLTTPIQTLYLDQTTGLYSATVPAGVEPCKSVNIGLGNDLEYLCVNGETWTHRRFAYYDATTGQQLVVVDGFFNPQGVEQATRPLGAVAGPCVAPVVDIEEQVFCLAGVPTIRKSSTNTATGVSTITWTTVTGTVVTPSQLEINAATFGACPPVVIPEQDLIKTNWLPICVGGVQWYVAESSTFNNDTAIEGVITKIYKQGAAGTITTTAPVGATVEGYCQADRIEVDTELICNEVTNVYDEYRYITTNGVTAAPVITATTITCDGDKPDVESVRVCSPLTNTYHIVTTSYLAGAGTILSDVDTLESCAPALLAPTVTVTTEPGCNNGQPVTRRTTRTIDNNGGATLENTVLLANSGAPVAENNFVLGACPQVVTTRDVEVGCLFNTGTGISRPIKIVNTISATGIVTTVYTEANGTVITPTAQETVTEGSCTEITVTESVDFGCAAGVPYTRRRNVFRSAITGQTLNVAVGYFNSTNVETATMPAGFTLGPCPITATVETDIVVVDNNICVENPVGTFTNQIQRSTSTYNNQTLVQSAPVITYSSNGSVFSATVPTGTIRIGQCATTPTIAQLVDIEETQWCVNNASLIRRSSTNTTTGVTTITWVNQAGTAATPTAAQVLAATPGTCPTAVSTTDVEDLPFCVNNTQMIRRTSTNTLTGVITTGWYNTSGVVQAPTAAQITAATFGACPTITTETDLVYSAAQEICVTNLGVSTTQFVRQAKTITNATGVVASTVTEYSLNGSVWTLTVPTGTIVAGRCIPVTVETDVTYSNWLPVCVSGVQWYIGEKISVANATGVETVTKVYKNGANGVPTATAPTGTQVQGMCNFFDTESFCYTTTATGTVIQSGWARHQDSFAFTPGPNVSPAGIAYFTGLGVAIPLTTAGFTIVPCGIANVPDSYTSTIFDLAPSSTFTISPTSNLVSWLVRNRNISTTDSTIRVNGGTILDIDPGEVIGQGNVEEQDGLLNDTVILTTGASTTLRVIILRKV